MKLPARLHWAQQHRHSLILASIYASGLLMFAVILLFVHRLPHSDDFAFQEQIKPFPTLFEWLNYRYNSWSGRIFAESFTYLFSPAPLLLWKLVSFVLYAVFSGFTFLYYLLFTTKRTRIKDYVMMGFALVLPLAMDDHVLKEGMLWVTGSMNYFWIATFALIALYPLLYYLRYRHLPHWLFVSISLPGAVIAASSQEQIGIAVIGVLISTLGYVLYSHRYSDNKALSYLVLLLFLMVASFAFDILAPGNKLRISAEIMARLPDFYTIPLVDHIHYGYRWFLDTFINRSGFLLLFYWFLLLVLFWDKGKQAKLDKRDISVGVVLALATLFGSLKGYGASVYLFNFHAIWHYQAPLHTYVTIIVWTTALLATACAPLILYRKKIFGYLLSLLFVLVVFLTILITLSPTMYASGFRVFYVPSVVLMFLAYLLIDRIYDQRRQVAYMLLGALFCLAGAQYVLLIGKILSH